ncbi:MAG: putative NADH-flavin reductase [Sphingomonas bacterium]|nr:putative NADH-flavin reductase [Sphingomonas bacterium]
MVKVVLIGATGFVGRPILDEALAHDDVQVTAIVRNIASLPAHPRLTPVACDIHNTDALAKAIEGHDAVIHAYHPGRDHVADPAVYEMSIAGHEAVIAAVRQSGVKRLLCVGGAASLNTPEGKEYIESSHWDPAFDPYKPAIVGTRALYYLLKPERDLDWVFVAPSAWLRPGERTGAFRYGKDDMLFDAEGNSRISNEDYALAMIEELRHPRHHRERFTVGY